jgi:hypothetical protein
LKYVTQLQWQWGDAPGRILLDTVCAHGTPLTRRTRGALMAAWDTDLREIMKQVNLEYAKASSHAH